MPSDYTSQMNDAFLAVQEANASLKQARKDIDGAIDIVSRIIANKSNGWLREAASITFLNGALTAIFEIDDNSIFCTIIASGDADNTGNSMVAKSSQLPVNPTRALVNAYALNAFATAVQCIRWY